MSYIDPNFLSRATAAAAKKAEQLLGPSFDIATVHQYSQVTADVSADTGNPHTYNFFSESSDFELQNPDFQLTRNRASEQGIVHNIAAIGLEVNADHGYAATVTTDIENQRIWSVVGDGLTRLTISNNIVASLRNGFIGAGKARQEVREGTVDILGAVQQSSLHPFAGLIHLAPGETLKPDVLVDGGRWGTLTMAEDFGLILTMLDIVAYK